MPIIGEFFSNTSSNRVEKELIITVTPYIVEPMAPGQVPPGPGDEVVQPNDLEFYLLNRIEGRTAIDKRATTAYDDPFGLIRRQLIEKKYIIGPSGYEPMTDRSNQSRTFDRDQPLEARMPRDHRRAGLAGLVAGLGLSVIVGSGPAYGQVPLPSPLPDALPSLPAPMLEAPRGPAASFSPAVMTPPEVRPTPTVIEVPPGGFRPTWFREADDPVATRKHPPKLVEHKRHSALWRRLQGKFYGYPEEFTPRPLGAAMYDHMLAMTANGAAARLTLYNFDFVQGSDKLSSRGADQLAKLVPQMLSSPYPLIIERTTQDPALAAARREAVATLLAQGPCPIPQDRVLVGVPIATGLTGTDAQVIAGNALGRVQQYGPPIPINSNGINSPTGVTISSAAVGP